MPSQTKTPLTSPNRTKTKSIEAFILSASGVSTHQISPVFQIPHPLSASYLHITDEVQPLIDLVLLPRHAGK
jgi:hypothetical protein